MKTQNKRVLYCKQYVTAIIEHSPAFVWDFQVESFLPYEYTCEGMLERVHAYVQNQVSAHNCTSKAPNKAEM